MFLLCVFFFISENKSHTRFHTLLVDYTLSTCASSPSWLLWRVVSFTSSFACEANCSKSDPCELCRCDPAEPSDGGCGEPPEPDPELTVRAICSGGSGGCCWRGDEHADWAAADVSLGLIAGSWTEYIQSKYITNIVHGSLSMDSKKPNMKICFVLHQINCISYVISKNMF